jgi:hypothetical protein
MLLPITALSTFLTFIFKSFAILVMCEMLVYTNCVLDTYYLQSHLQC